MNLNRFKHLFVCFPLAASLSVGACNPDDKEPVDPKTAALTVETNLKNISDNLSASTDFLSESDAIAEVLAQLQDCSESGAGTSPDCDDSIDPSCFEAAPVEPACGPETVKADLKELTQEVDEFFTKLVDRLREEVFIEANIESRSDTEIVYRLPTSVLCEIVDEPDCAMDAAKAEPRVKVTSPAKNDLDLAILMTSKRHQPLVFRLYRDRLGVTVDAEALFKTMQVVDPEEAKEVEKMSGVVSLSLVKNAARDFSFINSVEKDIDVVTRQEDGKLVEMHFAASAKSYELRLDGMAKTITAAVNMGPIRMKMPLENISSMVDAEPNMAKMTANDIVQFVLGGINGSITFDGNRDELAFKGLGLGDRSSAFTVNGEEILGLDVNKASGRRFDMTVATSPSQKPLLTFAPGIDIELRLKFQSIADKFLDIPETVLNDTLSFKLTGNRPSLRETVNGTEVVSGTLTMTSARKPSSNVTVGAGMCLVSSETSSEEALLSVWAAGACE